MKNFGLGEMVSSLGPLPSGQVMLFNNLPAGLPQSAYVPIPQRNPAQLVASSGSSMLPGSAMREQYIEWQGKKLLLGVDVDARQPWYGDQPNFLYKLQTGPVRQRQINPIDIPSGQPIPISQPLSPPIVRDIGEAVRSLPLPKESVKPYESLTVSPPSANLVAVDSYQIAPAEAYAPIEKKKLPAWAWIGIGILAIQLVKKL